MCIHTSKQRVETLNNDNLEILMRHRYFIDTLIMYYD